MLYKRCGHRTDKLCKRRTDIPSDWIWSAGQHICEGHTVWKGEWRWISYRAYSINACTLTDNNNCFTDLNMIGLHETNS